MAEEKITNKKEDFNLLDYRFHALGFVIITPILFWVTSSTNPFTEFWHYMMGIKSDKFTVFILLIQIVAVYYIIVLVSRGYLKLTKTKIPEKPVSDDLIDPQPLATGNVFSSVKSLSENKEKLQSNAPAPEPKKNEIFPLAFLDENINKDKTTTLIPRPKEKFEDLHLLASRLIYSLEKVEEVQDNEMTVLTSLNKKISEKTNKKKPLEMKENKSLENSQKMLFVNEKDYTETELRNIEENMSNIVNSTEKRKINIDQSKVPDLFAKKKINN